MSKIQFLQSEISICKEISFNLDEKYKKLKLLIVTDENVSALYSDEIMRSISPFFKSVQFFVIPPCEDSKSILWLLKIADELQRLEFGRSDVLCALGGGVVSDLACFAASIYMRGMEFISIPTTLLAMVDSAYGGKSGVNYNGGKNILGSFYFPSKIFVFTSLLSSLKAGILSDGLCEVVKYGYIYDWSIVENLETSVKLHNFTDIIITSIQAKLHYVSQDPSDTGMRNILNFGHTVGHAIESCSNYSISHGKAVGAGMAYALRIGIILGVTSPALLDELYDIFKKLGISHKFEYPWSALFEALCKDKKIVSDYINFILIGRDNKPCITPISLDKLKKMPL